MCRPVELQGWSTNEAIGGMGMSELGRGNPNYRGLKLFCTSVLPILFLSLSEHSVSNR